MRTCYLKSGALFNVTLSGRIAYIRGEGPPPSPPPPSPPDPSPPPPLAATAVAATLTAAAFTTTLAAAFTAAVTTAALAAAAESAAAAAANAAARRRRGRARGRSYATMTFAAGVFLFLVCCSVAACCMLRRRWRKAGGQGSFVREATRAAVRGDALPGLMRERTRTRTRDRSRTPSPNSVSLGELTSASGLHFPGLHRHSGSEAGGAWGWGALRGRLAAQGNCRNSAGRRSVALKALVPPTHTLIPPARHHVFVSCRLPAEDGDDDGAHADADLAAEHCRHLQGKGLSVWWVSEETQTPKPQQTRPPSIIVASKASHSSPSSPQEPRRASFVDVEAGATSTKAAAPEASDQGFFAQAAMEVAKLTERLTGSSMVVKEMTTNASSASAAFERADVNKDGVIDQSEFNAYLKSTAAEGGGGKQEQQVCVCDGATTTEPSSYTEDPLSDGLLHAAIYIPILSHAALTRLHKRRQHPAG